MIPADVTAKLVEQAPWAVVVILLVALFLRYLTQDRKEWRAFLNAQNQLWSTYLNNSDCRHAEGMARVTEEIKAFREDSAEHDRFVRETLKPATKRGLG